MNPTYRMIGEKAIRLLREMGRTMKRGKASRVTVARRIREHRAGLAKVR